MRLPVLLILTAVAIGAPHARAQSDRPSPEFRRRAAQWLESTESSRRQAAIRSYLQLGPEAMPDYHKALQQAARGHDERLARLASDIANNPYATHHEAARELDAERERVLALVRTDYHKDPDKVRMLREEMEGLGRLYDRTQRLAAVDAGRFDAALEGSVAALAEIARELERFEPDRETKEMDDEELHSFIVGDNIESQTLVEQRTRYRASRDQATALAAAEEANAQAGPWANAVMRDFTALLNRERAWLGLNPFRLEEKLSAAARGHSADMAGGGFFSHTSPIPGKESPAQRARLAGFTGGWSGENIFAGSPSHTAAFSGWFGSDGHRFIMFASGPNVIGVGVHGSHWTMMTGHLGS